MCDFLLAAPGPQRGLSIRRVTLRLGTTPVLGPGLPELQRPRRFAAGVRAVAMPVIAPATEPEALATATAVSEPKRFHRMRRWSNT